MSLFPAWPRAAFDMMGSADLRIAAIGKLLFAGWEQAHAAASMRAYRIGSALHVAAQEQQRRAYRDMLAARAWLTSEVGDG
jgi:hypothetical protein